MILDTLKEYFAKNHQKYGVLYAVAFGTVVTRYFREDSDVDIGVRFLDDLSEDKRLTNISEIIYDLEEIIGRDIDVCDISAASPSLQYEILTKGKLIFCRDRSKFLDDKTKAIMMYLDSRHLSDFHIGRIFRDAITRSRK